MLAGIIVDECKKSRHILIYTLLPRPACHSSAKIVLCDFEWVTSRRRRPACGPKRRQPQRANARPGGKCHHCALPGASARKRTSYNDCSGRIANPRPHHPRYGYSGDRRDLPAGLASVTHYESHRAEKIFFHALHQVGMRSKQKAVFANHVGGLSGLLESSSMRVKNLDTY